MSGSCSARLMVSRASQVGPKTEQSCVGPAMDTDLGYMTCNPAIGEDGANLFNALTGYSRQTTYNELLVAPHSLRQDVLARIDREIERHSQHGDGYLAFKMNALVDPQCIQAL